jgi:hypothetical protein
MYMPADMYMYGDMYMLTASASGEFGADLGYECEFGVHR